MGQFYVIRSFARPCGTLLYFQVDRETGDTRFIVKHARSRRVEKVLLTAVATAEILAEIRAKSAWNVRYGHALQTTYVSKQTKDFINSCWDELKKLKPQLAIKSS